MIPLGLRESFALVLYTSSCSLYICNIGYCSRKLTASPNLIFNEYTCKLWKWVNRPVNLFWRESSHFFGANSPVRNFERNVLEESSREELVLEWTVPQPYEPILSWSTINHNHHLFKVAPMAKWWSPLVYNGHSCLIVSPQLWVRDGANYFWK